MRRPIIRRTLLTLPAIVVLCVVVMAQGGTPPPVPPPSAPPGQQDPPQSVFRARVDSIGVDVTVTDKQGKPVTDLKAEDFEIREAGKPQTIDSFRFFQTEITEARGVEAPRQILSAQDQARETANPQNRVFIVF